MLRVAVEDLDYTGSDGTQADDSDVDGAHEGGPFRPVRPALRETPLARPHFVQPIVAEEAREDLKTTKCETPGLPSEPSPCGCAHPVSQEPRK